MDIYRERQGDGLIDKYKAKLVVKRYTQHSFLLNIFLFEF